MELMLKAMLLNETGGFPDDHQLTALHSKENLPRSFPILSGESVAFLRRLSSFYQLRYPRTLKPVSMDQRNGAALRKPMLRYTKRFLREVMDSFDAKNPIKQGGRILMEKPKDK